MSPDQNTWTTILQATMPPIPYGTPCQNIPVIDYNITVDADGPYFKFVLLSHYGLGGGLQFFDYDFK